MHIYVSLKAVQFFYKLKRTTTYFLVSIFVRQKSDKPQLHKEVIELKTDYSYAFPSDNLRGYMTVTQGPVSKIVKFLLDKLKEAHSALQYDYHTALSLKSG